MRVVLDTNVLISGILFSGPPSEILKAWRGGKVQIVLSPEIIDEYIRVSEILAGNYPGIEIGPIVTMIVANSETIQTQTLAQQVYEDPDDDKFLACALSGESKIIVSGINTCSSYRDTWE